jgi:hypothetical protein
MSSVSFSQINLFCANFLLGTLHVIKINELSSDMVSWGMKLYLMREMTLRKDLGSHSRFNTKWLSVLGSESVFGNYDFLGTGLIRTHMN